MNRRGMILSALVALLIPWRQPRRRPAYCELPLDVWLERSGAELPELATTMANMESGAVRHWHAREWPWLRYRHAISWREGVSLLYGFGPPEESRPASIAARAALERAGVRILGFGYSRDARVWTVFALGDWQITARKLVEGGGLPPSTTSAAKAASSDSTAIKAVTSQVLPV